MVVLVVFCVVSIKTVASCLFPVVVVVVVVVLVLVLVVLRVVSITIVASCLFPEILRLVATYDSVYEPSAWLPRKLLVSTFSWFLQPFELGEQDMPLSSFSIVIFIRSVGGITITYIKPCQAWSVELPLSRSKNKLRFPLDGIVLLQNLIFSMIPSFSNMFNFSHRHL